MQDFIKDFKCYGIELGSFKSVISKKSPNSMDIVLSDTQNIEIPSCVGFESEHRIFSEHAYQRVRRNYLNSVTCPIRLLGKFNPHELKWIYCPTEISQESPKYIFQIQNLDNAPELTAQMEKILTTKLSSSEEREQDNSQSQQSQRDQMEIEKSQQQQQNEESKQQKDNLHYSQKDPNKGYVHSIQVFSGFLSFLKNILKIRSNDPVFTVLSVPSYFTQTEKHNLQEACRIADLPVAKFVEEHVAIAYSYQWAIGAEQIFLRSEKKPFNVLFVDIGYSKTSVFLVSYQNLQANILSMQCNRNLGVRDIDNALLEHLQNRFQWVKWTNGKVLMRVLEAVEQHRKILSSIQQTEIVIEGLCNDQDLQYKLSRTDFEDIIKLPFLNKLQKEFFEVINLINKQQIADFDEIEILGGGARIPIVQELIKNAFQVQKLGIKMAVESISRGCAICSEMAMKLLYMPEENVQQQQQQQQLNQKNRQQAQQQKKMMWQQQQFYVQNCTFSEYQINLMEGDQYQICKRVVQKRQPLPQNIIMSVENVNMTYFKKDLWLQVLQDKQDELFLKIFFDPSQMQLMNKNLTYEMQVPIHINNNNFMKFEYPMITLQESLEGDNKQQQQQGDQQKQQNQNAQPPDSNNNIGIQIKIFENFYCGFNEYQIQQFKQIEEKMKLRDKFTY